MAQSDSKECGGVIQILRQARIALLVGAGLATMVALMLPGKPAPERRLRKRVEPRYPELARRLGITGPVTIRVELDCAGLVTGVQTIQGDRMLAEAAEEAVRQWRFSAGSRYEKIDVNVDFSFAA